jgi:hypothetical protein
VFSAKEEEGEFFIYFAIGISKFEHFKGLLSTDSKKEKYTYMSGKEKMQDHSLNTTLSVCKPATCFGYLQPPSG